MPEFDVAVIGSGTAAQNVVPRCAEAGLRVAVVDRLPYGGTCARRGCDPKKVLLAAAEAVGRARMLDGRGLTGGPAIDWPALMQRKRGFTEPVARRIEDWLRSTGAETMHGSARLLGAGRVEVDGRAFDAADIVVTTGARPLPLGIPGEELVTISDEFLELDDLPPRLVFIGGGYISFEFAWLARMAGAAVTILHRGARVLKGFDEQLAAKVTRPLPAPRHRGRHRRAGRRRAPAGRRAGGRDRHRGLLRRPRRPWRRARRRYRRPGAGRGRRRVGAPAACASTSTCGA